MIQEIRILALAPVVYSDELKKHFEDREKLAEKLDKLTSGLVRLDSGLLKKGVSCIENAYDVAVNTPYILKEVRIAEKEGYKGVIIDCFVDPGLDAAREVASIPVIGANEASCHLATQIAPQFSIINTVPNVEHLVRSLAAKYSVLERLASIKTINIPVLELEKSPKKSITAVTQATEEAVKEDGAYAIVLGCTGMSSLIDTVKSEIESRGIKVPVIEPLRAGVYTAIAWALMGVSQSKEAYRTPTNELKRLT